jgi:hypothetical protein
MIGKLIRALVGRSMARKHGLSGAAGAAAGLLAPFVIKKGASLIAKGGSRAVEARRRRRAPRYIDRSFTRL